MLVCIVIVLRTNSSNCTLIIMLRANTHVGLLNAYYDSIPVLFFRLQFPPPSFFHFSSLSLFLTFFSIFRLHLFSDLSAHVHPPALFLFFVYEYTHTRDAGNALYLYTKSGALYTQ